MTVVLHSQRICGDSLVLIRGMVPTLTLILTFLAVLTSITSNETPLPSLPFSCLLFFPLYFFGFNFYAVQVVSRSPTDTDPELSLSVRSESTRSPPSCSSASFPSRDLCVRSPKTSRVTFASSPAPSSPYRSPPRPISWVSSRTPTWPPSTPSASRLCPRTFSWPAVSVEREHKSIDQIHL